jgi:hypothetical protein
LAVKPAGGVAGPLEGAIFLYSLVEVVFVGVLVDTAAATEGCADDAAVGALRTSSFLLQAARAQRTTSESRRREDMALYGYPIDRYEGSFSSVDHAPTMLTVKYEGTKRVVSKAL